MRNLCVLILVFGLTACGGVQRQHFELDNYGWTHITGIADGVQEISEQPTVIGIDPGIAGKGIPRIDYESIGLLGISSIKITNATGAKLYINTALKGAQIRDLPKTLEYLRNPFELRP